MREAIVEFLYRFGLVKEKTVYVVGRVAPTDQETLEFKVGDFVWVGHCAGVVEDLALTKNGHLMLRVKSFKSIVRQINPEWLVYSPGMITRVAKDEFDRDYKYHVGLIEKSVGQIQEVIKEYGEKETDKS